MPIYKRMFDMYNVNGYYFRARGFCFGGAPLFFIICRLEGEVVGK